MKNFKVWGLISILSLAVLAGCTTNKIKVDREATSEEIQQIQDDLSETVKEVTSISTEAIIESDDSANFKGDADKFATKSKSSIKNKAVFYDGDYSIVKEGESSVEQNSPLVTYNTSSSRKETTSFEMDKSSNQVKMTSMIDTKKSQDKYTTRDYNGSISDTSIPIQYAYENKKDTEISNLLKLSTSGMRVFKTGNDFVYLTEQNQASAGNFTKSHSLIKISKVNDRYAITSYENSQEVYKTTRNFEDITPALISRNSEKGTVSYSYTGNLKDTKPLYQDYLNYAGLKPQLFVFYNVTNNTSDPSFNGWHTLNKDYNNSSFVQDSSYSSSHGTDARRYYFNGVNYTFLNDIFESIRQYNYNAVNYVTDLALNFVAGESRDSLANISKNGNVIGSVENISLNQESIPTYSFPMTYQQAQENYQNSLSLFDIDVIYSSLNASSGKVTVSSSLDLN